MKVPAHVLAETVLEAGELVEAIAPLLEGHRRQAILVALEELYAEVLVESVRDGRSLEQGLAALTSHTRALWQAVNGGPSRPQ